MKGVIIEIQRRQLNPNQRRIHGRHSRGRHSCQVKNFRIIRDFVANSHSEIIDVWMDADGDKFDDDEAVVAVAV